MSIHDLNRENIEFHRERILTLSENTPGLWGKMDAQRMVLHLLLSLEGCLDDSKVKDRSIPVVRLLGRFLVFDLFTKWPKGRLRKTGIRFLTR